MTTFGLAHAQTSTPSLPKSRLEQAVTLTDELVADYGLKDFTWPERPPIDYAPRLGFVSGRSAIADPVLATPTVVARDGRAPWLVEAPEQQARSLLSELEQRKVLAQLTTDSDQVVDEGWRRVRDAEPVRLAFVAETLGLPAAVIRAWVTEGLLEDFAGAPRRVGLESVARVRDHLAEIRAVEHDPDLMAAVLSALEVDELAQDERFFEALEQMRRGQRATDE